MTEEACDRETERQSLARGLMMAGGLGAMLWPLLSTAYYATYPVLAGGAMSRPAEGQVGWAVRFAEHWPLALCPHGAQLHLNPTALYSLSQAYVGAATEAEGKAVLSVLNGLLRWTRGLNQTSSLLYAAYAGLVGLALIRSRTWRFRG